jgi:Ca2+-binding RTX toxin-like protein
VISQPGSLACICIKGYSLPTGKAARSPIGRPTGLSFLYYRLDTNSPAILVSYCDNIEAQPIKIGIEKHRRNPQSVFCSRSSSSIGRTRSCGDNLKGNDRMASVPGGQYTLFANGNNMNVVATPDGVGLPPPVAGLFNLELLTSGSGSAAIPPGYQGVAMLSPDGRTINMAAGDYGVQVADGGPHTVIAGTGNDTIYGGDGPTTIIGGSGDDQIFGGAGPTTIQGGSGHETIYGGDGRDLIVGGSGAELIVGGNGKDTIVGGTGSDTIYAGHGGDLITGGSGTTSIFAGDGPDTITGGSGPTTITGGSGHDFITAGSGPTMIMGGDTRDTIIGGSGQDTIFAGHGGDLMIGGSGADLIFGGDGRDTIFGGSGPDTIYAGSGPTIIHGGAGADLIAGGDANDTITGGSGPATIDGGAGHNLITAGSGGTLIQDSGVTGQDTVVGFSQAHGDAINFAGQDAGTIANVVATANVSGGSTVITLPDGSTMTLLGITHIDSTFFH